MRSIIALFRVAKAIILITYYGALCPLLRYKKLPLMLRLWIYLCLGNKDRGGLSAALEHLGPAYIKIGQFFATRRDILPEAMCDDLVRLQDNVPSFSKQQAISEIERSLECPLEMLFDNFSDPIAAASVAQVHYATLKNSQKKVAIKILRPQIKEDFYKDIFAFKVGAYLLHFCFSKLRRLKLPSVVNVFEEWVRYELDLRMEAAAMSEYAQQVADQPFIVVPEINWEYTSETILVMEYIEGVPLTNFDKIKTLGVDLTNISRRLMQLFLRDATTFGYFHGDLHQGNIMITSKGNIALLDYGVMGRLSGEGRSYLAKILYGFVIRDYAAIARLHFEAGYVPAAQDINRFSQALRAIGEPVFGKQAADISMGRILSDLFSVTENFEMETRPELIALQKNLVSVEGVCAMLDPTSNIWITARPLLEEWIADHLSVTSQLEKALKKLIERFMREIENIA